MFYLQKINSYLPFFLLFFKGFYLSIMCVKFNGILNQLPAFWAYWGGCWPAGLVGQFASSTLFWPRTVSSAPLTPAEIMKPGHTGWPVKHDCVFLVPWKKVACPVYTCIVPYNGQVTFYKVQGSDGINPRAWEPGSRLTVNRRRFSESHWRFSESRRRF